MKDIVKKYIVAVISGILSGAIGTSGVLYYDNIAKVFSCMGDVTWQNKD